MPRPCWRRSSRCSSGKRSPASATSASARSVPSTHARASSLRLPRSAGFTHIPLKRRVEDALGIPTSVVNDTNAAALAEWALGSGRRSARHFAYVTVSTGIGCGLLIDGDVINGRHGAAGELGHCIVEPGGPPCTCGGLGHLEGLASGTAIAHQARDAVAGDKATTIGQFARDGVITAETAYRAAAHGDGLARRSSRPRRNASASADEPRRALRPRRDRDRGRRQPRRRPPLGPAARHPRPRARALGSDRRRRRSRNPRRRRGLRGAAIVALRAAGAATNPQKGGDQDAGILDPRRVVTFAAVAREGSFSRAAAALSLSQPAVSQQISALETDVGARLLERRPDGLVLTEAGRTLVEHAAVIAERLELADVQLRELVHGEPPPVADRGRVPSALAGFVPTAVNALRRPRGRGDRGRGGHGRCAAGAAVGRRAARGGDLSGLVRSPTRARRVAARGHLQRAVRGRVGARSSARAPYHDPARRPGG